MGIVSHDAIKQFQALMEEVDEPLKNTFQNVHQGFIVETLVRFLKARDWNVAKAHKMLLDCLNWRVQNDIDSILAKPIIPTKLYRALRDSHLLGLSGYSKEGFPVFAIGVGQSTFDKASVHYYVQAHIQLNEYRDRVVFPNVTKKYGRYIGNCVKVLDMTGLKLSALSLVKLLTVMSTIDDLNYPEKTNAYYIVNVPYVFSACWKVVKPLLQERTRRKVQVLQGSGRDELLKIMDYESLPHFCKREGSSSSRHSSNGIDSCFSLDHVFHQELYNYIKKQFLSYASVAPVRQGSFHVEMPDPDLDGADMIETFKSEFLKVGHQNGLSTSLSGLKIDND